VTKTTPAGIVMLDLTNPMVPVASAPVAIVGIQYAVMRTALFYR
jgi:hypothetical protein